MSEPNPSNPSYRHAPNAAELIAAYKQCPTMYGWRDDENDQDGLKHHAYLMIYEGEKHHLEYGAGRAVAPDEWAGIVDALCAEFRAGTIEGLRRAFDGVPEDLT